MKKKHLNLIPDSLSGIKKKLLTMKLALIVFFISVLQVSAITDYNNYSLNISKDPLPQNKISGTVSGVDGSPLPGVNVIVTGKTQGAITDVAGKYSIEIPEGARSLTFSFVGMESQVVTTGDFMTPGDGNLPAKTISTDPGGNIYKVSERLIQEYDPGDQRLANNYTMGATWIGGSDRGTSFNTRYTMLNGGNGLPGVIVLGNQNSGEYELYMATTYEENELMKAEAKINTGDVEGGLSIIDELRIQQGAGLALLAGNGLSAVQANEELRRERRVELAFRGLSFYDARRWGVIYDGRTGCIVIDQNGTLNTNATINYNYLDYWDVPDNELAYNPASPGSAPVKNPE